MTIPVKYKNAVFLDLASVDKGDMDLSALRQAVAHWTFHAHTESDQTYAAIKEAELVVSNKVVLDKALLEKARQLKLVCIAATGTNNIDIDAASSLGIAVCNVTRYATPSVVQHTFRLILALAGRLWENVEAVHDGTWSHSPYFCLLDYPPMELTGKTLGIVGFGELGQAVARVAEAFGLNVLLARRDKGDNRPGRIDLHQLLPRVDILSLHCPLTKSNRNLIGKKELSLLPKHALLINTARGGLVNESDLMEALEQQLIGGAGLDVISREPPDKHHPLLQRQRPNLIITPHMAWASQASRQRLINEIALNITAYQQGKERNQVNLTPLDSTRGPAD